jgi:small GTP-binding protein
MGIFDRLTDQVDKIGVRVGGFLDEVFLPEELALTLRRAAEDIERGDYDEAQRLLARALDKRPEFHRTHHLVGLCHYYSGDYPEAIEAFERAIELREEAISHFYTGLSQEQLGHPHEAKVHFQRAFEVEAEPPYAFDLRFGLGRVFMAMGRPDKAARELRKALKNWADHPEATVALAEALLERDELDEARELLETDAAERVGAETQILLGKLEEAAGRPKDARDHYEEALDDAPDLAEARIGAARACIEIGEHLEANEHLLRALSVADAERQDELQLLLGKVNEAVANPEGALEHYERALDEGVGAPALIGAGRVLLRLDEPERAVEFLERAVESNLETTQLYAEALVRLGEARLELGELSAARRLLEQAKQALPQPTAEILRLLADVSLAAGDPAEAIVALEEARAMTRGDTSGIDHQLSRAADRLRPDWDLPETLRDAVDMEAVLDQLRDHLGTDPRLAQFTSRAQSLHDTLNAPLSIAIVGEFNAGKSTLLNAVLGEDVVPMGVLPTTAHTCHIQYGPRKAARVEKIDGTVTEVTLAEAKQQMKEDADDIDHLEFVYPHPELRSVEFWDTPGFNALEERHEETATRALDEAEAILWVLDANQALSQTEWTLIEDVPDSDERLILVLNKVDRLGEPGEREDVVEEIIEYVRDNAGHQIAGIFPMSALQALERRTGPAGESRDDAGQDDDASGFSTFTDFLDERVIQRSGRIKTLEIGRQLVGLVEDIMAFRDRATSTYEDLSGKVDELREWLVAQADEIPSTRAHEETVALQDQFDFVLTGVERELRETLRSRGTILTRGVLADEDREFLLELLRERVDDVLDRSHRSVLTHVDGLEASLADRLGPIIGALELSDARAINRRLEGFYDESRVLEMLLEERVFGRLEAKARAKIDAAGWETLESIRDKSPEDVEQWKGELRRLLPSADEGLEAEIAQWYGEFFLAARRFSDRVQRDLNLLKMEAEHRFDVSDLLDLVRSS